MSFLAICLVAVITTTAMLMLVKSTTTAVDRGFQGIKAAVDLLLLPCFPAAVFRSRGVVFDLVVRGTSSSCGVPPPSLAFLSTVAAGAISLSPPLPI